MFDRGHMVPGRIAENRAQVGGAHFGNQRAQFIVGGISAKAMKYDARVRISGAEMDRNRLSAMNADARQGHA